MSQRPIVSLLTSCYHGAHYLADFFANVREQSIFDELEIVLVLNEPSDGELAIAHAFQASYPDHIQILIAPVVESLGSSWNRAWMAARGIYVGMWNIDDQRPASALEKQMNALKNNSEIALVYGDYLIVSQYGARTGTRRITPDFNRKLFEREFPLGGAFFLWRKEIAETTGFFDEHLKCAVDFDLSVRIVLNGLKMGKVPDEILGYFTNENQGLSTANKGHLASVERTVLQYRYGIFDLIRPQYKHLVKDYQLYTIWNFNQPHSVSEFVPDYDRLLKKNRPLWILGKLRNTTRSILSKLGIIDWIYQRIASKSFIDEPEGSSPQDVSSKKNL